MAKASAPRLRLYGRSYCHLCEDMIAALGPLREEFGFALELVDVDSDPALERRYGPWVPVLAHEEVELCHYHLDASKVRAHLLKTR